MRFICDRIAVIHKGVLVELAETENLFAHPLHPYTRSLLSAIPLPNPHYEKKRRRMIYVPSEAHDYSKEQPELREVAPGHFVSCNRPELEIYQRKLGKTCDGKGT